MSTIRSLDPADRNQIDDTAINSYWNFKPKAAINTSTTKYMHIYHDAQDNINGTTFNEKTSIKFLIRDDNNFLLPQDAYLEVRVAVTRTDVAHVVALNNPMGHVLFSAVKYSIGANEIEDISNYYPYKALAKGLTRYTRSSLGTTHLFEGWALDGPLKPEDWAVDTTLNSTTATNAGFKKRLDYATGHTAYRVYRGTQALPGVPTDATGGNLTRATSLNLTYNFKIPLREMFAFCTDVDSVFMGDTHTIELIKNNSVSQMVTNADGLAYTLANFTIENIKLYMPYVKPSGPVYSLMLDNFIKPAATKLLFYPSKVYLNQVTPAAAPSYTLNWDITNLSLDPISLCFFMTHASDLTTGISKTTFIHNFLTKIKVTIGAEDFPQRDIECDFPNKAAITAYERYKEMCVYSRGDVALSYEDFLFAYPMFCFDFKDVSDTIFAGNKSVRITAEFSSPLIAASQFTGNRANIQPFNAYAVIDYRQVGTYITAPNSIQFYKNG